MKIKEVLPFIYSAFISVITWSCEPSRAENGDYLNGLNQPSSTQTVVSQLSKIHSHSLDEDSGTWEDRTTTFQYQNTKLSSYTETGGELKTILYNSEGKIQTIKGGDESSTFEYIGGQLSKITSVFTGTAKITTTFSYANSVLSKCITIQEFTTPLPLKFYIESAPEFTGSNVTKMVINTGIYVNGSLQMDPDAQINTLTYDTKNAPYQLLPKEFVYYWAATLRQAVPLISSNNFTKITTVRGTINETESYTFQYNSANFPVQMNEANGAFIKYEYK